MSAEVIIIGSGPAGVSAAWPLVRAGVSVLMLDASGVMPDALPHQSLAALRNDPNRLEAELGFAGALATGGISPKFATPLARAALAGFERSAGVTTNGYMALGSYAAGGLSRIEGKVGFHAVRG